MDEYQDPYYEQFVQWVYARDEATVHDVQRYFLIGYNRASRLIERMEEAGQIKRQRENWNTFNVVTAGKGDRNV